MIKEINSHTSSNFQKLKDRIISNFKNKPIVQDLDLIRLEDNKIKFLIEVKQSSFYNWLPFIKKYKPNLNSSKLDDINYKALYALAKKIPAELLIYYYNKNELTKHGIKIFKILDMDLNDKKYGYYTLDTIRKLTKGIKSSKVKNRNFKKTKDFNNPNISTDSENIYSFFQNDESVKDFYYVEHNGLWTMLLSNGKDYEPLWIYIEFNIKQSKLDIDKLILEDEFFPQIEIHKKTNVPFSIIAYNDNLTDFIIYKYENLIFIRHEMNFNQFVEYYSSYIQKLNT